MSTMKFAFSTLACPKWDFQTIADRAKEYGYDGVELRGFLNESELTASNVFLSDPAKVRGIFAGAEIEIACLSSAVSMVGNRKKDAASLDDLRKYVDMARQLGCPLVKVFDTQVKPGWSRASAGVAYSNWIAPIGDYAADRGVTVVVENALSFRFAKELWMILERLNHPSISAAWDLFNAALVGEQPSVSVPTLNHQIEFTQVKDAKLGPLGASYCKLGEGDVPVEKFLIRLRGIGYTKYVSLEWEKAWLPGIAEPEEILPDAIQKLRQWTRPQIDEAADAKKKAHAA